jgi:type II secretory pathway predicted ATPase ExeA
MYRQFWGLKFKPFRNTPDPRFLCSFPQYSDALMKLTYTVRENMGAGMLTGVYGCGKTLVINSLISSLNRDKYVFSFLTYPPSSGSQFLRALVRDLKFSELPTRKNELMEDALLEALQAIIQDNDREGKNTVIILDEAHLIAEESIFETIRMLLNFQKKDRFLITLILAGQPELAGKVANLRQLEQRIALKCHLGPLDEEETKKYVKHRLQVAGAEREIFQPDVYPGIFRITGGIPRRINHVCDLCLMTGFARKKKSIDLDTFREAQKIFGTPGGESDEPSAPFNQPG